MRGKLKRRLLLVAVPGKASGKCGFTLIEILIIVTIVGILASIAIMVAQDYFKKANNKAAGAQIAALESAIASYYGDNASYPDDLSQVYGGNQRDPWNRPFQYLRIDGGDKNWHGNCRRDRNLNPLNTDFDLYSMGADGKTAKQVNAKDSLDDIIRANNGSFIGLGAAF
jgi:general secretion pathway protein G